MNTTIEKMQIAHVGVITNNLNQYIETFKTIFTVVDIDTYDFIPKEAYMFGKKAGKYKLKIAIVEVQNGYRFEIIEPIINNMFHKKFLIDKNGGLNHIAFYTEQYDDCLKKFKGLGWDIVFEAEVEDEKGHRRCFYAQDKKLNCLYEFVERPSKKDY